ncbi:hypothetical protein MRX96_030764 [Rhipicephalus microplus]
MLLPGAQQVRTPSDDTHEIQCVFFPSSRNRLRRRQNCTRSCESVRKAAGVPDIKTGRSFRVRGSRPVPLSEQKKRGATRPSRPSPESPKWLGVAIGRV